MPVCVYWQVCVCVHVNYGAVYAGVLLQFVWPIYRCSLAMIRSML